MYLCVTNLNVPPHHLRPAHGHHQDVSSPAHRGQAGGPGQGGVVYCYTVWHLIMNHIPAGALKKLTTFSFSYGQRR